MKSKTNFIISIFILAIISTIFSCQKKEEEPLCCQSLDLIGQWNIGSYWHILPDGERILYGQNRNQAVTENLFPDRISGQIIFREDNTFSENLKLVIIDSFQVHTIESNLNGTFIDNVERGGCNAIFESGNIIFQVQSEEIFSSASRNCSPSFDFPIVFQKKIDQDSFSFQLTKQ